MGGSRLQDAAGQVGWEPLLLRASEYDARGASDAGVVFSLRCGDKFTLRPRSVAVAFFFLSSLSSSKGSQMGLAWRAHDAPMSKESSTEISAGGFRLNALGGSEGQPLPKRRKRASSTAPVSEHPVPNSLIHSAAPEMVTPFSVTSVTPFWPSLAVARSSTAPGRVRTIR